METEREMYKQIHDASYCGHYTGEEGAADTSVRRNSGHHRNGRSTTRLTMKTLANVIYIVVLVTDSVIGLPVSDNLEADALVSYEHMSSVYFLQQTRNSRYSI